jgi:hypothetical protein
MEVKTRFQSLPFQIQLVPLHHGTVSWGVGDLFVVPKTIGSLKHTCASAETFGGAALYWVHDEPLMDYLGGALSSPPQLTQRLLCADVMDTNQGLCVLYKRFILTALQGATVYSGL